MKKKHAIDCNCCGPFRIRTASHRLARKYATHRTAQRNCRKLNAHAKATGKGEPYYIVRETSSNDAMFADHVE